MSSVRFKNFWQGFNQTDNIFVKILNENFQNVTVSRDKKSIVDLEIHSVFRGRQEQVISRVKQLINQNIITDPALATSNSNPRLKSNSQAKRTIWYTGENIRPPLMSKFDAFLSFDQESYDGRNAYLPLWWLRLNWFEELKFDNQVGISIDMNQLLVERKLETRKTKFACAFIGNPHPIRMHFIEKLAKLGQVDIFGRSVGKPVSNKFEIATGYKYAVCFENDLFPGYVTEKLIDAYATQTVPIYWGNLGINETINPASFINLADFASIDDIIDEIRTLNYEEIYSEKFLYQKPSLDLVSDLMLGS
jgi:hypothetical protein